MDEVTRLRMAFAASMSRHSKECECGRRVFGSGLSHQRACPDYLARHGWPFNDGEMAALRKVARDSVIYIEDSDERLAAWLKILHDARFAEARRRGLLPPQTSVED